MTQRLTTFLSITTLLFFLKSSSVTMAQSTGPYYELRVYHLKDSIQMGRIGAYLKDALVPALHRASGNKVGLFSEQDPKLGTNIYLFRQISRLEDLSAIDQRLLRDETYQQLSARFNAVSKEDALYDRIETTVLSAFPMMKFVEVPSIPGDKSERVYELRSYESATEALGLNKVHMFNEGGEITLFKRLQFNAVFYARVIAGAHMPNLMYMTVFANRTARDAHWKAFGDDPQWKVLVAKPEYQNNVSHIDDHFLKALPGSDI